jgi:transposase
MERKPRRKFSADFKVKVVLEAIKERSTIEELARKYELHPNQIGIWKKDFLDNAASVFEDAGAKTEKQQEQEADAEKLFAQIGRLKMENEWLKKKLQ